MNPEIPFSSPQELAPSVEAEIEALARLARSGGIFAFPTETVYGLGADASNDAATAQIFAAKGRPVDHPLIVHVHSIDQLSFFAQHVPPWAHALMRQFWPGPLSLVLPRRAHVAQVAAGGQASIALRCPAHPLAQALLRACVAQGVMGLAAPSANRFGRISPTTAAHVRAEFGADVPVLDGGPCEVGIESSIIDCTRERPVLLRAGVLTRAQIEAACGLPLQERDAKAPKASGTLASHYAPRARLRLMSPSELAQALPHQTPQIAVYRLPQDPLQAAHDLFAALRAFDDAGVQEIWVEQSVSGPEWEGVLDRLQRAAA